jgi:biopolymer transport protein TolR
MGVLRLMQIKSPRRRPIAEINVVPYIDVMLVLLVIFMATTPLLSQGVNVDLPQASAKAFSAEDQEPVVVSVDVDGKYYLNTAANPAVPLSADELYAQVSNLLKVNQNQSHNSSESNAQQSAGQRPIVVKGDKNVDYGKVVAAMVLLQQAGAQKVGLMTQTPEENPGSKG